MRRVTTVTDALRFAMKSSSTIFRASWKVSRSAWAITGKLLTLFSMGRRRSSHPRRAEWGLACRPRAALFHRSNTMGMITGIVVMW